MKDNKTVLTFEEKHHILEVDEVEYEIPQRTAELEEKIREHDAKLPELTEYEGNMLLLEILFGKEKAQQMFPDGKNTNLDKLAKVSKVAIALYMAEFQNIKNEKLKEQMKEIQPQADSRGGIVNNYSSTYNIQPSGTSTAEQLAATRDAETLNRMRGVE